MTNASDRLIASTDALLTERFGPLPQRIPGHDGARARFIATMHALIAWLIAHPEVPAPWSCMLGIHVADVAALLELADQLDMSPWPSRDKAQSIHIFEPVDSEFHTPISISVIDEDKPL